jgi:exopolysaccharide biosynthesis WecB/TagA/CpsF family protein
MSRSRRYVIISPCRDEAAFMRRTLESVKRQCVQPAAWIVVDDGSTDSTPEILAQYAKELPYLRVVRREDRGHRSVGPGVIDAFNVGLRAIEPRDFDYLCKLDLDLELPPGYFEGLLRRMEKDSRLGTCSGQPWFVAGDGRVISEGCGPENSVGMTKFYRTDCFLEIGGFVPHVMWDGIDCHRCRMAGWRARSFDDPALRFLHLRPMGSSVNGLWTGRWRHGAGQWFMGTSLSYMTASALYRAARPPRIWGGAAMWLGFVSSMLARRPRYDDRDFRRALRRFQIEALVLGKKRALRRFEARYDVSGDSAAPPPQSPGANGTNGTHGQNGTNGALHPVEPLDRASEPRAIELEGVKLHALDEQESVAHVMSAIEHGRGGWIVTPNLDHVRRLQRDEWFREVYRQADLAVADGMPLVWACRLQKTPLPGRVAGSDLIWSLSSAAARRGASIFLLGGDPGTAEEAAARLRERYEDLRIAGIYCPEPGFEQRPATLDEIAARLHFTRPDLVYVALGSPKQERLIQRLRSTLPGAWWLGCGISFSFVAGRVHRAPRWLQRVGLEWTHRLFQEPRRLARRYLVDGLPFAAGLLARSILRGMRSGTTSFRIAPGWSRKSAPGG